RMTFIEVLLAVPGPFPVRGGGPSTTPASPEGERQPAYRPPQIWCLLHRVGHDADEARALDGAGELALLQCRNGSNARWNDLAALRDVTLQQPHVLVVDLGRVGAGERAGLAAALERPARLGRG